MIIQNPVHQTLDEWRSLVDQEGGEETTGYRLKRPHRQRSRNFLLQSGVASQRR
jgi:hypothetical protein